MKLKEIQEQLTGKAKMQEAKNAGGFSILNTDVVQRVSKLHEEGKSPTVRYKIPPPLARLSPLSKGNQWEFRNHSR